MAELNKLKFSLPEHPPIPPNLAPSDHYFFISLKQFNRISRKLFMRWYEIFGSLEYVYRSWRRLYCRNKNEEIKVLSEGFFLLYLFWSSVRVAKKTKSTTIKGKILSKSSIQDSEWAWGINGQRWVYFENLLRWTIDICRFGC